jgi:sensor histidine kinase YesM
MFMFIPPGTPFARAAVLYLFYVTLLNTAIAVFITYALRIDERFFITWVFSMLIGFSITSLIDGFRWLIWKDCKPNGMAMFVLSVLAAPLGYFIGNNLGRILYGHPVTSVAIMFNDGNRILLLLCILISFSFSIYFWNKNKIADLRAETEKEKSRNAAIEKQTMQAQLQLLQAQIEPHMLFNTLANLQGLIAIDTDRAQYMLEQLIVYLRASLTSSRTEKTTLKHEFSLLKAYLELMAIRMGKRLTYALDLPAELQEKEIAPMLLQPLVENAIKHGLEPKMQGGSIRVQATQQDGFLHLSVTDTGLGLASDHDASTTRTNEDGNQHQVGNANVRQRLLALYGPAASLSLEAHQPEGVTARITIPLPA